MSDSEIHIVRDARIDHLGFVGELWTHFDDQVKPLVKSQMAGKSARYAEADFFTATLAAQSATLVNAEKLLRMYEKKQITRGDFLSAIGVKVAPLKTFLSDRQIGAISVTLSKDDSLTVKRKRGAAFTLVEAVRAVAASVT